MFFPEYLNQGSRGPAVALLQVLLKAMDFDPDHDIVIDGDYGEKTAQGVRELQKFLQVETDGHFGPDTRAAFLKEFGFELNQIPANVFQGETQEVGPA